MDSIGEKYRVDQGAVGPARSELAVSVRGLVKRYASHEAVAGIDLEVRRGEIFAFLGPNGAGKTTTVEILEGFRQRTAGQVSVLGHDPDHVPARDLPPGLSSLTEPGPGGSTVVHSQSPLVHLQLLGNWALGRGFDLPDLDVHRPALEEVYLSLTGPASTKDQR